jgi:hypothetical protein
MIFSFHICLSPSNIFSPCITFPNYHSVHNCRPSHTILPYLLYVKGKVKFHPVTCREGTEGSRSRAVLCLNLGTKWGRGSTSHPGRIPAPIGGVLVGPRAGLDGYRRRQDTFRPTGIEPRTIQYVDSRYSGSGIAAPITVDKVQKSSSFSLRNFFRLLVICLW